MSPAWTRIASLLCTKAKTASLTDCETYAIADDFRNPPDAGSRQLLDLYSPEERSVTILISLFRINRRRAQAQE